MTAPRKLVVVGFGGFARETVELIDALNDVELSYHVLGHLDDDPALHGVVRAGRPVLGPVEWLEDHPDVFAVLCVGRPSNPIVRRELAARLALDDDRYVTLVHPAASVGRSVAVGPGTVIHAGSVCTADITIGRHVEMMPQTVLTHDVVVDDGVTFGAGARIAGGATLEADAYIGSGACVRERLTVGAGSVIGMGAVVVRDVPSGEIWAGNPAQFIRSAYARTGLLMERSTR